jgi:hypothetical protein
VQEGNAQSGRGCCGHRVGTGQQGSPASRMPVVGCTVVLDRVERRG